MVRKHVSSQQKWVRSSKFPDVEALLMAWLQNVRAINFPITTTLMTERVDALNRATSISAAAMAGLAKQRDL